MTGTTRLALVLALGTGLCAMEPLTASARTKSIVKYGAIGLGAAALYNMGQRSAYHQPYYHQPHYYQPQHHYGYAAPQYYAHPGYAYPAQQPVNFHFNYSRHH